LQPCRRIFILPKCNESREGERRILHGSWRREAR
jgi:hypothetical protein